MHGSFLFPPPQSVGKPNDTFCVPQVHRCTLSLDSKTFSWGGAAVGNETWCIPHDAPCFPQEHGHPGKARPAGAHQPPFSCQAVWENGGICGGSGYVVSRAALQRLRSENQSLASFLEEFQRSANTTRSGASDIFASCFFFSRNIAIKQWSSEYTCLDISGNFDTGEEVVADFEQTTQSWHKKKPSALHVMVPKRLVPTAMRAVRALYK